MTYDASERAVLRQAREIMATKRKADKQARPKSPKASRGRVIDHPYLAWVRRQPCAVGPVGCGGAVEAAHVRLSAPGEPPTGLQRKPDDARAVPLCHDHHTGGADPQHGRGERAVSERKWWERRGVRDPLALAATYHGRFEAEGAPFPNRRMV